MRNVETVRQTDHAASRLARQGGDSFFDPRVVVNRSKRHGHPERRAGGLDRAAEECDRRRSIRVENDGDPGDTRRDLLQQFEPFSHQRRVKGAEPGDIAAGSREALNKALSDGIGHPYENDWYCARLLPQRRDRRGRRCQDCVRRQADQLRGIGRRQSWIAGGKSVVDLDILALDPPETPEGLREGVDTCPSKRVVLAESHQHADTAHPLRLLGVPGDEPAPSHSITSSARSSMLGGTVRPSALAVFRLMISEYLVGCWTGRSAGLVPLRMRSM